MGDTAADAGNDWLDLCVDEVGQWAEITALALVTTRIRAVERDSAFTARLRTVRLGASQLSLARYGALLSQRTPRLIRQSDPELFQVALIESGRQRIDQARNQAVVGKGDMVLYDSSRPFDSAAERCAAGTGARSALLQFPKAMLPFPARRLDRLLAVRLDARQGAGRLLAQFLAGTAKECGLCTPLVRARLGNTAVDLATAVIAQYLNSEDAVPADSRRRAQFLGITAFIEQHLGDPSLTVGEIASAHHMSTRSLHRLFQEHGHSVGAWIRDRRMERCGHDLADPLQDHLSIGAVAARWGFGRAADFTRAFRARHGTTPSAYRRRAQGPARGV